MRLIKSFEEYLNEGIARRVRADINRARSLVLQSKRKITSLKEKLEKIGIKDENANDYVEHIHDILMILIRAEMYVQGYAASGQGAHEAEVAYLKKMGFEQKDVVFMDQLRYFRNGILYYGTNLPKIEAERALNFLKRVHPRLLKIILKSF